MKIFINGGEIQGKRLSEYIQYSMINRHFLLVEKNHLPSLLQYGNRDFCHDKYPVPAAHFYFKWRGDSRTDCRIGSLSLKISCKFKTPGLICYQEF